MLQSILIVKLMGKILYIRNPAAFGGSGPAAWEQFKSQWPDEINPQDVFVTQRPGHALDIAAASDGYDILTAVGGDGTVGEIISGIMEHPEPRPKLAIIPGGTGNDIGRNAGIRSVEDTITALRQGSMKSFDIIRIDGQFGGKLNHRYSFLHGNAGFSAISMVKPWMKRILGPKGAYYLGTIIQILAFRALNMTVRWEAGEYSGRTMMVIIANVERSAGGSMCIAPGAKADDGELNVTIMPFKSRPRMMFKLLPKVPTGSHIDEPGVKYFQAKRIEIVSDPQSFLDLDGDILGTTPAVLTIQPQAIEIMTPK